MITVLQEKPTGVSIERPHISYTQVSMFTECTLHWWMKYVCGIKKRKTIHLAVGDVIHRILARNFRQKAVTYTDLPVVEMLDEYYTLINLSIDEGLDIIGDKPLHTYKDAGAAVFEKYIVEMTPSMHPMMIGNVPAVELELRRRIPETDYDMLGYIDLQLDTGTCIDYKVNSRKWYKGDMDRCRQALAYCMLFGEPVPFSFHVFVRDAEKPAIQEVPAAFTQEDVDGYISHLWSILNDMELTRTGEIEPAPKDGYCNEYLCRHHAECQKWKYGIFDPDDYLIDRCETALVEEE
ncbi:MAG: PD-(D/E)XK nuclease family protein [Armatimonadota bacterium]